MILSSMLVGFLAAAAGSGVPAHETATRQIVELEQAAANSPSARSWTKVAAAYRRLARLTGDARADDKAWSAVQKAVAADPTDADTLVVKAWVQSARHDFEGAAVTARDAVARQPLLALNYGVLADALTELGRYEEAVQAVETMVRIRPDAASYSRAAHLRGLHGDRAGAVELMKMAVGASSATDAESLAWNIVMLGHEYQSGGDHEAARREYKRALMVVPDYHLALYHLGDSQASGGDLEAAVASFLRLHTATPTATSAAALGTLLEEIGQKARAQAYFAEVAAAAAAGDPSRAEPRWLARFHADRRINLQQSIDIVRDELKTHQDVETWDGLAWALERAGKHAEALQASDRAMRLGTVNARMLYHRGVIETSVGRKDAARASLERALALRNLWPAERREAEGLLRALPPEPAKPTQSAAGR